MLYPVPAVLVTTRNAAGADDVCTVAWTGTICSDPAMVSISLRKSRLSYEYLTEAGVFVINLTTEDLAHAADFCGVKSGRETDKFEAENLTKFEADEIPCACIEESPVNIECRVTESRDLGSHTIFLAEVLCVHADEQYMDADGKFDLAMARPIVYSHGEYYGLGQKVGKFGFSVRKKDGRGRKR